MLGNLTPAGPRWWASGHSVAWVTSPGATPIGFAHRGGRGDWPENTLAAFGNALAAGASGLESDVWLTGDGVPVLDHDGVVRQGVRRRRFADLSSSELPASCPTLESLYTDLGNDFELSVDVKDPDAARPVVAVARAAGGDAVERLWLCSPDWQRAASWRSLHDGVHLVDSTRLKRIREGVERRAASLASAGVDALNMHWTDWTTGNAVLLHRFERLAFAWDCQHERILVRALAFGVDAVYCDHVGLMMRVLAVHAS